MNAVTKIKGEFQSDHARQLVAIRSDIERLRSDLVVLGDDVLNNDAAKQRRKTRPGSELFSQSIHLGEPSRVTQQIRQRQLAGAALAGAIVIAASGFAIWLSRHPATV